MYPGMLQCLFPQCPQIMQIGISVSSRSDLASHFVEFQTKVAHFCYCHVRTQMPFFIWLTEDTSNRYLFNNSCVFLRMSFFPVGVEFIKSFPESKQIVSNSGHHSRNANFEGAGGMGIEVFLTELALPRLNRPRGCGSPVLSFISSLDSQTWPCVGCTPRGSYNNTLLRRVRRRFSNSKCFLEGFLEGACM